jgi:DNA-binding NarL/FixJ family response regulator
LRASGPPHASLAKIRIVIVDDHPIFRDGLRHILEMQPDFDVVGQATDGAEAIRVTNDLKPDVLLLDFSLPCVSGLEVIRDLDGAAPTVRTIVLTAGIADADIVKVLRLGARGVVLKGSPTELLYQSIRSVFAGGLWIGPDTMKDVAHAIEGVGPDDQGAAPRGLLLTRREQEVLGLVVEGHANKGIALKLSVGQDTVKHHLTSIFNKTGVSSRLELALFAIHRRLVRPARTR